MIYYYNYKIQLYLNREYLSANRPKKFRIKNKSNYEKTINLGKEIIKTKTAVICTTLRDISDINDIDMLSHIIQKVENLGNAFRDYRVLIVENDSQDGTREALLAWNNPKVTLLGCGYNSTECHLNLPKTTNNHDFGRWRIEKMAYIRNIYLREIQKTYFNADYMIVWDLDTISSVYNDGIVHSIALFELNHKLDAVCAYGMYKVGTLPIYYDTYAHQELDSKQSLSKLGHDLKTWYTYSKYSIGDQPISVSSCFGGFTIYKIKSILDKQYEVPKDKVECEHVSLCKDLNIIVNPSMINLIVKNA